MQTTDNAIRPTRVIARRDVTRMEEMDAWTTASPGLVVIQNTKSGEWIPLHERSGLIIPLAFDNPELAQSAAARLGELRDWTRRLDDIELDALQFTQTWRDLVEKGRVIHARYVGREDLSELSTGA